MSSRSRVRITSPASPATSTTNVDFWCRVMGLRFVKNTLNFETTFRYHTYFGDEEGNPGSVVTFLEFKEAPPGVPGDGDIQRMVLRVALLRLARVLDGPADRQPARTPRCCGSTRRRRRSLVFWDPEHHEVELMVSDAHRRAAGRRRRRHPGRAPHPRPRGRALVHDARGAAAVRRAPRLPRRRHAPRARRRALRPLVLLRAARAPERRRPRRRLAPHRLRRRRRRRGRSAPATRPTRACARGRRSSTTTSSTAATRCLPEGGWRSARRGLDFSSTRSSRTSETDSVSRLEWSRFAPSSKPS